MRRKNPTQFLSSCPQGGPPASRQVRHSPGAGMWTRGTSLHPHLLLGPWDGAGISPTSSFLLTSLPQVSFPPLEKPHLTEASVERDLFREDSSHLCLLIEANVPIPSEHSLARLGMEEGTINKFLCQSLKSLHQKKESKSTCSIHPNQKHRSLGQTVNFANIEFKKNNKLGKEGTESPQGSVVSSTYRRWLTAKGHQTEGMVAGQWQSPF